MPQIIPAVIAAVAYVGTATTAVIAGTATLAQIATVAAVGIGAGVGSAALSKAMMPQIGSQGAAVQWIADPDEPLRFAFGRIGVKGSIKDAAVYGVDRMYVSFACTVSAAGPIKQFVSFRAGDYIMSFDGGGKATNEPYRDEMWLSTRLGQQPDTALSLPSGLKNGAAFPFWGSDRKLSGSAAYLVTLGENSKRSAYDGKIPAFLATIEGLYCYDPRLDSTYPGGSGACRLNDPATWVWTENPILFALKWALGLWEGPTGKGAPQVDYQVGGIGAKVESIRLSTAVEAANVADFNGWTSAAWPSTDDDKAQVLDGFLQAGGARYAEIAGQIAFIHRAAPRSPVFTVTARDTAGPVEIDTTSSKLNRINTLRPRYWSEAHEWEMTALPEVTSTVWQEEDGQGVAVKRTRGGDFSFVPQAKQARELASLEISHSREAIRGRVALRPYMDPEPGNCFIFDEPDFALSNLKCFVLEVEDDTDSDVVVVTFETETDGKYPFAYGQTDSPPPSQGLNPIGRAITAPSASEWSLTAATFTNAGASIPALVVSGAVDSARVELVIFEFRVVGAVDWTGAGNEAPGVLRKEITGLTPGTQYEVSLSYRVGLNTSARLILGPVTAGTLDPGVTTHPRPNIVDDAGFQLGGRGWTLAPGITVADDMSGRYLTGAFSGTAAFAFSPYFPVTPGQVFSISGESNHTGVTAGGVYMDIEYYVGTTLAGGSANTIMGSAFALSRVENITVPAGVNQGRLRFYVSGVNAGAVMRVRRPKVEAGARVTAWNDDATTGATYDDGVVIDLLRPAETGAQVTTGRIAGGITGQTAWATLGTPTGFLTATAPNLVYDGGLGLGAAQWALDPSWTWVGTTEGAYLQTGSGGTAVAASRAFPVTAGVGYFVQAELFAAGMTAGTLNIDVAWYNASSVLISTSARGVAINGQGWTGHGVAVTAPAGATTARFRAFTETATNTNAAVRRVKVAVGGIATLFSDDATTGAAFSDGVLLDLLRPAEVGAEVTTGRIAGGFTGQGALATQSQVTWATQVTGVGRPEDSATRSRVFISQTAPASPTANDIWVVVNASLQTIAVRAWNGASWLDGGDVTGFNIAAGFTGQGALATLGQVTWATHVTGVGRPEDYATLSRVFRQQAAPTSPNTNDIWVELNAGGSAVSVRAWNGSAWITGADITLINVAAGFTGQTAWATLNTPPGYLTDVAPNLIPDGGLTLGAVDWSLSNWSRVVGGGEGPFLHTVVGGTNIAQSKRFVVSANTVFTLQAELFAAGLTAGSLNLDVAWFNSGGALISNSARATAVNGATWTNRSVTVTSPATAAFAEVRVFTEASTNTSAAARRIKLAASSIVTLFTDEATGARVYRSQAAPASPGLNDLWIVLNGSNVAVAVQSWNGTSWVNAADITGLNIASGFTGQGALATLSQVTWATQVTGIGRPEDYATQSRVTITATAPASPTPNDIWVVVNASFQTIAIRAWNGAAWLDGGNVTGFFIAAGFTGQGPGATETYATHAGNAAALAAGLAVGRLYLDSTNANRITAVVAAGASAFSAKPDFVARTKTRVGAGSLTSDLFTLTPMMATGAVTYSWAQISGPPMTITAPTGAATAFQGALGASEEQTGFFMWTASDAGSGTSDSGTVRNTLISNA